MLKLKSARGVRVPATCCAYDPDGERVAGGTQDGSVQVWATSRGASARPDSLMRGPHGTDAVSCVAFAPSGRVLTLTLSLTLILTLGHLRRLRSLGPCARLARRVDGGALGREARGDTAQGKTGV